MAPTYDITDAGCWHYLWHSVVNEGLWHSLRAALTDCSSDISRVARLANTATMISMESKIVKGGLKEAVSSLLAAAAAADAGEWQRVEINLADVVSRCSRVMDELARERNTLGHGRKDGT